MKLNIPALPELEILIADAKQGHLVENIQWLAALIDHTLLKLDATEQQHIQLCQEAKQFKFATVCVYPKFLPLCRKELAGTEVKAIAVIGFPTGAESTQEKVKQTKEAIALGAQEIDMVLAVHQVKRQNWAAAEADIFEVVKAAGSVPVKVILETCLLTKPEVAAASAISKAAGAAFVKTSTGFSKSGATAEDIALMRAVVGTDVGVKASGGVRNLVSSLEMVIAGANRIGTSNGVSIMQGTAAKGAY